MKKVLLVEDEESVRDLVRAYFLDEDFLLELAADGTEAMERLASSDQDLVILDMMLPGMSGMEIIQELERRGNSPPVIVMTGKFTDEKNKAMITSHSNVAAFLQKPILQNQLLELVHKLLDAPPGGR